MEESCGCSWFRCVLELLDVGVAEILAGVHFVYCSFALVTVLGGHAPLAALVTVLGGHVPLAVERRAGEGGSLVLCEARLQRLVVEPAHEDNRADGVVGVQPQRALKMIPGDISLAQTENSQSPLIATRPSGTVAKSWNS